MQDNSVRFGAVIVGDELLTGKRQDAHLPALIDRLAKRGLELYWVRYVGDDDVLLVETYRQTLATGDVVFSFGGIGATPDDKTRQSVAAAAGKPLLAHPDAVAELEAQFGPQTYPQRVKMAEFPEGSRIIPNPINRVAGFSYQTHHFVPGFPKMAWPMVEWVLDHEYPHLCRDQGAVESIIRVFSREGVLIPTLETFTAAYPDLRLSCLPKSDVVSHELELAFRGEASRVAEAMVALQQALTEQDYRWEPL